MCLQKSIVGMHACVYTGSVSENVMWGGWAGTHAHAHRHVCQCVVLK